MALTFFQRIAARHEGKPPPTCKRPHCFWCGSEWLGLAGDELRIGGWHTTTVGAFCGGDCVVRYNRVHNRYSAPKAVDVQQVQPEPVTVHTTAVAVANAPANMLQVRVVCAADPQRHTTVVRSDSEAGVMRTLLASGWLQVEGAGWTCCTSCAFIARRRVSAQARPLVPVLAVNDASYQRARARAAVRDETTPAALPQLGNPAPKAPRAAKAH